MNSDGVIRHETLTSDCSVKCVPWLSALEMSLLPHTRQWYPLNIDTRLCLCTSTFTANGKILRLSSPLRNHHFLQSLPLSVSVKQETTNLLLPLRT